MKNTEEIKKVEDALEKPLFNISKVLIITMIAIVVIILFIFLYIFIISKNENKAENNFKEIFQNKDFKDLFLEEKLKICLEKEEFDKDCKLLFTNPNINKECGKFENEKLRDKCFYEIALANYNDLYCIGIQNEKLKEDCEIQTIKSEDYGLW